MPQQKALEPTAQQTGIMGVPNAFDEDTNVSVDATLLAHRYWIHFHWGPFENGNGSLPKDGMKVISELFHRSSNAWMGLIDFRRMDRLGKIGTGGCLGCLDGTGNARVVAQEFVVRGNSAQNVHDSFLAAVLVFVALVIRINLSVELVGFLLVPDGNMA